jgi:hypothetical protein
MSDPALILRRAIVSWCRMRRKTLDSITASAYILAITGNRLVPRGRWLSSGPACVSV